MWTAPRVAALLIALSLYVCRLSDDNRGHDDRAASQKEERLHMSVFSNNHII